MANVDPAVMEFVTDVALAHQFVRGGPTDVVNIGGYQIPSIAKWYTDNQAAIIDQALLAQKLALPNGLENVGFIQAANAGAVAAPALLKLRERLSIEDFMTTAQKSDYRSNTPVLDYTDMWTKALTAAALDSPSARILDGLPGATNISAGISIPTTGRGNLLVRGTGHRIRAAGGLTDYMLKLQTANYNGNNFKADGLILEGGYKAKGFLIDSAQEWDLSGVKLWYCMEGIRLMNTYYGEVANMPLIRDCLIGLGLGNGVSGEVNTIDFRNLKINFSVLDKTLFVPKNPGESDADYNLRVPSIGVNLACVLLDPKFAGLTLEGMDHGFFGMKHNFGAAGVNSIKFAISECYFEAIKVSPITLTQQVGYQNSSGIIATVEDCWFAVNTPPIQLGHGRFTFRRNGNIPAVNVTNNTAFRCVIDHDFDPTRLTLSNPDSATTIVRSHFNVFNANPWRYNPYGTNTLQPTFNNMMPSVEDGDFVTVPSPVRKSALMGALTTMHNVTARPLTFTTVQGRPSGAVVQGATDGFYYMVGTDAGASATLTRVENLWRLDPPLDSKLAMELYRNPAYVDGTVAQCIDLGTVNTATTVTKTAGKWLASDSSIVIGTGAEIAAQTYGATFFTPIKWNAQIDAGYNWQGSFWAWGPDWFGTRVNIRAIGTLAQRPATPAVKRMVYFATDQAVGSQYTEWKNSAWGPFVPFF